MNSIVIFGLVLNGLLPLVQTITTVHHDKPPQARVSLIASVVKEQEVNNLNITLPPSERHKRLLPYMNFYLQHAFNQPNPQRQQNLKPQRYRVLVPKQSPYYQQFPQKYTELTGFNYQRIPEAQSLQQQKTQHTPFTESNALPGPFLPMKTEYSPPTRQPNFSDIYDKLSQLKLQQQLQQNQYNQNYKHPVQSGDAGKTLIRYVIPVEDSQRIIQQGKPIIQTYTATNIDVPPPPPQYQQVYEEVKEPQYTGRPVEFPQQDDSREEEKQYNQELVKPIIIIGQKFPYRDAEKQKIFEQQLRIFEDQQKIYFDQQRMLENEKKYSENKQKQYHQNVQENYVPKILKLQNHRYVTIQEPQNYQPPSQEIITIQKLEPTVNYLRQPQTIPPPYNPEYKTIVETPPVQNYVPVYSATENPNNLGQILRKLQETNALPQTLTPDNIDNSIKTLVRILNTLRKHQRLSKKPIVVPDLPTGDENVEENETDTELGKPHVENIPGTTVQNFPGDTPEGGTPGKAGVDYPALSSIPQTRFSCKTQRYKGFFGDPDTNCQVWHYCDFNGGQASFLCPNGTIFSQVALTCDWWYNVKCATTAQLYVLNERLYKYILPFSPKFPEDYSGPLVDRYLALKFQEMEEKMKKQRKKAKEENEKDEEPRPEKMEIDDADQLQMQNEESRRSQSEEMGESAEIMEIK